MKTKINDIQVGCTICAAFPVCLIFEPYSGTDECEDFEPAEDFDYFSDL